MHHRFALLLALPLGLAAQAPPSAPSCDNTPAYSTCELSFQLPANDARPNPYSSVELSIEFRSPHQKTYLLPGFWDGSRVMVRFSPVEAGQYAFRVKSNLAAWDGKEGSFTATASDAPGFVRPAEMHHWAWTERQLPHLWMGFNEPHFASMDDAAFRAVADARAAQKFNHMRGLVVDDPAAAWQPDGGPNVAWFQRLDQRILYLNRKGIVADLVLARDPSVLMKLFPNPDQRRRFVSYVVARYAAMNVTWQGVENFEGEAGARALLKEIGGALKQTDPYDHPRTAGARVTSASLMDDGWMNFVAYGPGSNDSVGAIEHQLYPVPFVNAGIGREDSGAGKSAPSDADAAAFRHRLWSASMDGQYPTYENTDSGPRYAESPGAKAMTAWHDFFSGTRHWELEPYFDVDGGRALALEDAEYIVYIEKPGPLEVQVEKRSYNVIWMNPATGETVREKKEFKGDHFTGAPPDPSHDWVLHLVRPGRLESLARTYKFESRLGEEGSRAQPIGLQEIETNPEKVPFAIEAPTGDLSLSKPAAYSVKLTKQTRATRSMTWLWTGDVTADGEGYRVLATAAKGEFQPPAGMARDLPATLLVRLYGMNANGKVYMLTKAYGLGK